jgi:PHD/YefM family antitoxin component YafN of YafNO toxin-antitoxin module
MIATERTQSLTDFRLKAAETLERLNQTGEAEIITVNGQARAVLLSPAVYDEMTREYQLTRDVQMMRRAMQEIDEGKGLDARAAFDDLRARLLAMKTTKNGKAK